MQLFNNPASLAAVDALGRVLTTDPVSRPPKERKVGLFYFLWCGEHGRHHPYDISKITAEHPDAGFYPDSPLWGSIGTYHHWGEPFYGYYYSDDEWIVRRHMLLFLDAGIDFLFFDTTNAMIYEKNAKLVMRVLQEYYDAGFRIPKVMFYTHSSSGATVQELYDKIYAKNWCPDTWLLYDGKPLIIAIEEECSPQTRAFFHIKMAQWPNEPSKRGGWPWMDFTRPQRVFENLQGVPEVINASVAQHPQLRFGDSVLYGETTNCGRAYHNGANDPAKDAYLYGYNFEEQLERAIEADPPFLLITGWNEWIAGRWEGTKERPVMFVDCANYEYSRDIEMMRGGYFDAYYLQMINGIRRFKGQDALTMQDTMTWYHAPGGNLHRDHDGYGTHYQNTTGRNALRSLTVSQEKDGSCTVTVRTYQPLSADRSGSFLQLFLKTDAENGSAYTVRINDSGKTASLLRLDAPDAFLHGTVVKTLPVSVGNDFISCRLPAMAGSSLWIKAADSTKELCSPEDFYDHGDTIPAGRLYGRLLKHSV